PASSSHVNPFAATLPPMEAGQVPRHLGDFEIQKELGRGGMGAVYLAVDPTLGRQVALKVLSPGFASTAQAVDRFLRESRAAASIVHANVVTRALGPHEDERPELRSLEIAGGDRFLLCTDGLSGPLDDAAIAAILGAAPIDGAADRLVQAAYDAGSRDNITAVVVEVGEAV
ncbi:MAG TPA: hypothetical protein PKW35_23335, partial [Nannocystaceae bacterium]|nr:hypothetical protein [Nannocystaceae bacterium]